MSGWIKICGLTSAEAVSAALQAGCDAYLAKPCPPDVLHLQLRALLRMRSGAQTV